MRILARRMICIQSQEEELGAVASALVTDLQIMDDYSAAPICLGMQQEPGIY